MPFAEKSKQQGAEVITLAENEKALIAMASQGDQGAFQKLYQMNLGKVYALCLRLTGTTHHAEEATQEVFVTVWKKLKTFKGQSSFSTWLHSLSRNTAVSYMRRHRKWKEIILRRDDEAPDVEQVAEQPADFGLLDRLLPRLPAQARMVFVLHAIEGLRHEEIAKTLKISTATSKVHFHRAKTLLTKWVDTL